MKRTVLPLLFTLVVSIITTTSYSQNKKHYRDADSLAILLSNKQLDSATAYNKISKSLLEAYNYDSAYYYMDKARKIANRNNDTLNIVRALNNLGTIYYWRTEFYESIETFQKAIALLDSSIYTPELGVAYAGIGTSSNVLSDFENATYHYELASKVYFHLTDTLKAARILFNTSVLHYYSGNPARAKEACEKALEIFERYDSKSMLLLAHMQLGQIYTLWGNYVPALNHLIASKNLIEEVGEYRRMGGCLLRIGNLYKNWGNNDKAHEYYEEALIYYEQQHDSVGISSAYMSIGNSYRKKGEYNKALDLYHKQYIIDSSRHLHLDAGMAFYYIGEVYNDMGKLDSALMFAHKVESIHEKADNHLDLAHIKDLLGRINLKLKNYSLAKRLIFQSLNYAIENNQYSLIVSNYEALSLIFYETKDYKRAYEYLDKRQILHDSIFTSQTSEKIAQIQSGYEIQRKDNQILRLNEEQKIQDLQLEQKNYKLNRQRRAVFGFIIAILLISALVMVLLRQILKKNKAYKMLEEKNIQINQNRKELIRATEKAEESDKLKTAFLANISHEIRNPLNVILGMSEVMAKNNFTGNQKEEYLNMININGEILLGIINDVLDMAKIESGVLKTKIEKIDQDSFFKDIKIYTDNLKSKINKEHIDIRFDLNYKNINLKSDSYKLNQIFSNLLMNAMKFTETGHIVVGDMVKDGKRIFYIKDTGIGISEDDLEVIFNRFIQADNSLTKKYQGTGLGLAITRSLVTMLDGRIWVESEPGKGSTFYFTLHSENGYSN